jgi:hypothetical protein
MEKAELFTNIILYAIKEADVEALIAITEMDVDDELILDEVQGILRSLDLDCTAVLEYLNDHGEPALIWQAAMEQLEDVKGEQHLILEDREI